MKVSRSQKNKKLRSIRFPARINEMIEDIQVLMNSNEFTEALMYILIDWEKNRYYSEKKRLLEQQQIRFAIIQHLSPPKQKCEKN